MLLEVEIENGSCLLLGNLLTQFWLFPLTIGREGFVDSMVQDLYEFSHLYHNVIHDKDKTSLHNHLDSAMEHNLDECKYRQLSTYVRTVKKKRLLIKKILPFRILHSIFISLWIW